MTENEMIQRALEKIREYHRTVPLKEQWARLVAAGIINNEGQVLLTKEERAAGRHLDGETENGEQTDAKKG
jgi:hypothetical protein